MSLVRWLLYNSLSAPSKLHSMSVHCVAFTEFCLALKCTLLLLLLTNTHHSTALQFTSLYCYYNSVTLHCRPIDPLQCQLFHTSNTQKPPSSLTSTTSTAITPLLYYKHSHNNLPLLEEPPSIAYYTSTVIITYLYYDHSHHHLPLLQEQQLSHTFTTLPVIITYLYF